MNEIQMQAAKKALAQWLSDEHELGKAPSKIECAGTFRRHDMTYYIFKYKKSLLGKWLVGVSGGYEGDELEHCGHVFSEMEEFDPATAEEKCTAMVELVREFWMRKAQEMTQAQEEAENAGGTEEDRERTADDGEEAGGADGGEAGNGGSFVAFVLLDSCRWDPAKLKEDLRRDWGIVVPPASEEEEGSLETEDSLIFQLGGKTATVGLMPAPVPDDEAEEAAATNYMWGEAQEVTKTHQAHLMVAVLGDRSQVKETAKQFVELCDACLKQENALGIYTCGTVYPPDFYHDTAELIRQDGFPVLNLVYLGLYRTEEGMNGYTYGMTALGKDEIEVIGSTAEPGALREFLFTIAYYVLDSDVVLRDGETIGFTQEQKLPITRSAGVAVEGESLKIGF